MSHDNRTPGIGGFKLPDEVESRGFIMDEDSEWALRDAKNGLAAVATLFDGYTSEQVDPPEIPGCDMAALFRTFERSLAWVLDGQVFANQARVRTSGLN